jgi:DNA polymerase III subunit epsilon
MGNLITKTNASDTYGSLGDYRHIKDAQCPATEATTRARLFSPPAGWPVVGNLLGATRWAAIDTETSGLDPSSGCRCIEVAAVLVDDGRVTREWSSRISPGPSTTWEEGAIACNGVRPEDLDTAPPPTDVWGMFVSLTAGLPLVAHNAQFDRKFIEAELAIVGLPSQNVWHCTMGVRRRRLSSLYYDHARRRICGEHTALGDARAVAYLAPRVCRSSLRSK